MCIPAPTAIPFKRSTAEIIAPFTLFFSSKGKGGTGIGLYVARQVVMQHGGRIEVASVKGEGSTFTVTMPRILAK